MKDHKIKDLGIKIGSKKEALWTKVKTQAEATIETCEGEIAVQKELLSIAARKIKEEQR